MFSFAYSSECVVLHNCGTGNATEKTLLHPPFEAEDGDLWGGNFDLDRDVTDEEPWEGNEDRHSYCEPERLGRDEGRDVWFSGAVVDVELLEAGGGYGRAAGVVDGEVVVDGDGDGVLGCGGEGWHISIERGAPF